MSALPALPVPSGLQRVWQVVSDLLIATALIWTPALLIAALAALLSFVWESL